MEKTKVLVIVGPTAVGKTALSIELAKQYNGEIISGDSMQVYRGLDIGTAKITKEEMEGIPHHLLDIKDPSESFSVAEFQTIVREKIEDITNRGKLPILVGGTGLYVNAVLFDYRFTEERGESEIRERLQKEGEEKGFSILYDRLMKWDPKAAESIHPNNHRRVIRALEILEEAQKPKSEVEQTEQRNLLYDAIIIGLDMNRQQLYERINERVERMMESGLEMEAQLLYDKGIVGVPSVQGIGYKELYECFSGEKTREQAVADIQQNSRRYAKRQLTWFRNKTPVEWFQVDVEHFEKTISEIQRFIKGKRNNVSKS